MDLPPILGLTSTLHFMATGSERFCQPVEIGAVQLVPRASGRSCMAARVCALLSGKSLPEVVARNRYEPGKVPRTIARSWPQSALVVQVRQALQHCVLRGACGGIHDVHNLPIAGVKLLIVWPRHHVLGEHVAELGVLLASGGQPTRGPDANRAFCDSWPDSLSRLSLPDDSLLICLSLGARSCPPPGAESCPPSGAAFFTPSSSRTCHRN